MCKVGGREARPVEQLEVLKKQMCATKTTGEFLPVSAAVGKVSSKRHHILLEISI